NLCCALRIVLSSSRMCAGVGHGASLLSERTARFHAGGLVRVRRELRKSVVGEIVGTDGAHKNTTEMLCQEYVLRSERVLYRIRPRDEKHPVLLPIGEDAEFRLQKDKLYLKVAELAEPGGKERGLHRSQVNKDPDQASCSVFVTRSMFWLDINHFVLRYKCLRFSRISSCAVG
ncbi:MAG: hypothetical protein ACXVZV_00005, partial [Terriglobales bacterium]